MLLDNQTGQLSQVTDGTANETDPVVDGGGVLSGLRTGTAAYPAGNFIWRRAAKFILSFPARSGGLGRFVHGKPRFMNTLHALTGLPAYNFGKSGLRSTAVAARRAIPLLYAGGWSDPSQWDGQPDTERTGPHASASNGAMAAIKCQLAGVDGTFNWDGMQASFTRDTAGSAKTVSVLTPLFVYPIPPLTCWAQCLQACCILSTMKQF
ncbi:hypothetical protein EAO14_28015 [Klebsiella pneumoniae]|nr:hypothetical protein EAO14_28015 [Klebsiella pneumoniae]